MATITLSGTLQIAADAPSGSVVGTFNADGLTLQTNPFGLFIIVGRLLCVRWITRGVPGSQPIQVQGPTGSASFTIVISAPASAAVPIQITLSPAAAAMPDNAVAGAKIATAAVKMSDGSVFGGSLSVSPVGLVMPTALDLTLSRALTTADDGSRSFTITAAQNGAAVSAVLTLAVNTAPPATPTMQINGSSAPLTVSPGAAMTVTAANGSGNPGTWLGVYAVGATSGPGNPASWKWLSTDDSRGSIPPAPGATAGTVHLVAPAQAGQHEVRFFPNNSFVLSATSAPITVQITAPPPPPPPVPTSVTLTRASVSLPDNSVIGTTISAITVAMSDGSAFTGTLSIFSVIDNTMVGLSGAKAILARGLAAADDGVHNFVISAVQGGATVTATLMLTVTAAVPQPPRTLVLSLGAVSQPADDSAAGLVLATATVAYSDGTAPANVTLTSSDPSFVTFRGMQLVLARALTSTDAGTHTVKITASDGLGAFATMRVFGGGDEN